MTPYEQLVEDVAALLEPHAIADNAVSLSASVIALIRERNGRMTGLPICCVTGRIAGDCNACGDCDPCGAAERVPAEVKKLLAERDDFANRYSQACGNYDFDSALLREAMEAMIFIDALASEHCDYDADPDDLSPEDMHAYRNGLIVQRARAVAAKIKERIGG